MRPRSTGRCSSPSKASRYGCRLEGAGTISSHLSGRAGGVEDARRPLPLSRAIRVILTRAQVYNCESRRARVVRGPQRYRKNTGGAGARSELKLDLYRLDLSAVVNKYVGETEKNLNQVFSRAEELNVILLLDEGDSLLTKRTACKVRTIGMPTWKPTFSQRIELRRHPVRHHQRACSASMRHFSGAWTC